MKKWEAMFRTVFNCINADYISDICIKYILCFWSRIICKFLFAIRR